MGMTREWVTWLLLGIVIMGPTSALAQPDLSQRRQVGTLIVYADDRRSNLYYYAPNELTLAELLPGKPDLHVLQIRYTGTAAGGDQGRQVYRSLLNFRVRMPAVTVDELQVAKGILSPRADFIELRPLPIRRVEAALVYTALNAEAERSKPTALPAGYFQESEKEKPTTSDVYWSERIYTLSLDNDTAQVFWSAFQKGQVVLSLGYAFMADGVEHDANIVKLTGSAELIEALQGQIGKQSSDPRQRTIAVVRTGAFAVTADAGKWPDLFKRIDLNDRVPPGYATIDIYCYDFQSRDIQVYEKRVEIEAEGVTGDLVRVDTKFRGKQPDIYARNLRFPFAVRLDRPYRYRVVTTALDGTMTVTPWLTQENWVRILDVTEPSVAQAPKEEDQDP